MEAELERVKLQQNVVEHKKQDEKIQESLKKEAENARKDIWKLEKDFAVVAEERDKTKLELEEMKRMYAKLERRMKAGKWRHEGKEEWWCMDPQNISIKIRFIFTK